LDRQDLAQVQVEDLRMDTVTKAVEYESEEVMFERMVPFREPSPFKFTVPRSLRVEPGDAAEKLDISRPSVAQTSVSTLGGASASGTNGHEASNGAASPVVASINAVKKEASLQKISEARLKGYEGD